MAMKWRPNDLRVANILRRNFSEKEIDENFQADIDRREFPEIIGFYREVNPLLSMTFVVNSSAFSLCEDYQQDAWNPYPEILPPEEGEYLITVKSVSDQRSVLDAGESLAVMANGLEKFRPKYKDSRNCQNHIKKGD